MCVVLRQERTKVLLSKVTKILGVRAVVGTTKGKEERKGIRRSSQIKCASFQMYSRPGSSLWRVSWTDVRAGADSAPSHK